LVLSDATIHGPLSLYRTKIGDHLRAHGTCFEKRASFQDVAVADAADFRGTLFQGFADFRRASFADWAILFATDFLAGADFFGARFAGEFLFNRDEAARNSWGDGLHDNRAKIGGPISFSGAYFYRQAVFDGVTFPA